MSILVVADPSVAGPKIHFGNQGVTSNEPGVFPDAPSIVPGPIDQDWDLIEWSQQEVIDPAAAALDSPATYDPALGETAAYAWQTADGESGFAAYATPAGAWVYQIASAGTTASTAEQDLFLQTAQSLDVNMGGNEVDFAMSARVVSQGITAAQRNDSAVFAGSIIGFTFGCNQPTQPDYDPAQASFSVFLQIPVSSTQDDTNLLSYFLATTTAAGQPATIIADQLRSENTLLLPSATASALTYNLSAYVADLASYLAVQEGMGQGITDLNRWTLNGVYAGVMTQGAGTAETLQLANLQLTRADAPSAATRQINPDPAATPDGSQAVADPTGNAEEIARLYQAAFGTHPDAQTLSVDTAPVDAGSIGLLATAQSFLAPSAGQTEAAFVRSLYENALGRAPEASGFANAVSALAQGMSRAALLDMVATSPEAVENNLSWDGSSLWGQDYRIFETVLGRAPDFAAQSWMASLAGAGLSASGVAAALTASAEAISRYAGAAAAATVEMLYQQGLGRAADPAGLANASVFLHAGGSSAVLASGIASSAEARSLYAAATHANWVLTAA